MSSSSKKPGNRPKRSGSRPSPFVRFLRTRKRIWIPSLAALGLLVALLIVFLSPSPLDAAKTRLLRANYEVILQINSSDVTGSDSTQKEDLCSRRLVMRHREYALRTVEVLEFRTVNDAKDYYDLLLSGKYTKKISASAGTDGYRNGRTVVYGHVLAVNATR